jgi:hypothetical protein
VLQRKRKRGRDKMPTYEIDGEITHTVDEIKEMYEKASNDDELWEQLEGSGEDIELSDFVGSIELYYDIHNPTIIYEDKAGNLWYQRDESELEGYVWVLPLKMRNK